MMKNKIGNLYKRFSVYFYYTARPHYVNPIWIIRKLNEISARKKIRNHKILWGHLGSLVTLSQSTGCEFPDYLELYDTVIRQKPKYILELGSGISSCVIASALKELGDEAGHEAFFVSMEEDPYYHDHIQDIFPHELKPYVTFIRSDRKEKMYGDLIGCYYENIPDHPYDFVFIDGPTLRTSSTAPKCFNGDFINIAKKSNHSIFGILDQRIGTFWALRKLMPNARIRYHPIKKLTFIKTSVSSTL